MDSTRFVAWWGAALSTVVFLWDIYKYLTSGPRLRFSVHTDLIIMPSYDQKHYVQTEVTNYGDRSTTLTNIELYYFEKPWSWAYWRNRPTTAAVLNIPNSFHSFPYELKPGNVWSGLTEQTPELKGWATKGVLYFYLHHSHHPKPVRQRVRCRRYTK